jgi:hypothetical protein
MIGEKELYAPGGGAEANLGLLDRGKQIGAIAGDRRQERFNRASARVLGDQVNRLRARQHWPTWCPGGEVVDYGNCIGVTGTAGGRRGE